MKKDIEKIDENSPLLIEADKVNNNKNSDYNNLDVSDSENEEDQKDKEGKDEKNDESFLRTLIPVLYGILSALFSSLDIFSTKLALISFENISLLNILVFKFSLFLFYSSLFLIYSLLFRRLTISRSLSGIRGNSKRIFLTLFILLTCGLIYFGYILLRGVSIKYISIGDSTMISCTNILFTSILAYFILKENTGFLNYLSGIIVLKMGGGIEVIFSSSQQNTNDFKFGLIYSFASMACLTILYLGLRALKELDVSLVLFSCGIFSLLFTLALTPQVLNLSFLFGGGMLVFICVAGSTPLFLSLFFLFLSMRKENAGVVALLNTLSIIFSYGLQILCLHQSSTTLTITGGCVVVMAVVISVLVEHLKSLSDKDSYKRLKVFMKVIYILK